MRSMYLGLVERMVVWCSWIWCPKLILCFTMADLSGCSRQLCCWCSFLYDPKFPVSWLLGLPPAFTLVSCSAYLTLKMEAICSSETSVDIPRATRRYIPEDSTLHDDTCLNGLPCYVRVWRALNAVFSWIFNLSSGTHLGHIQTTFIALLYFRKYHKDKKWRSYWIFIVILYPFFNN
jgi:hypothetical protein